MTQNISQLLASKIRDIPDFPKPGIIFKDIMPLLADPHSSRSVYMAMAELFAGYQITHLVSIEARGFIFGAVLSQLLDLPFATVRKPGKLPGKTRQLAYTLEYGEGVLEMQEDSLPAGARVGVVDDVLATGGTVGAACELIRGFGAEPLISVFAIELAFLGGRSHLAGRIEVASLLVID